MNRRLRRLLTYVVALGLLSILSGAAYAQEETSPENRFLLTGYGFATYVDPDVAGEPESFNAAFVPIFLYQVGDKFLFEAELEFEFEDDAVETEVEYAQIDWLAHDNATVVAGKFLTPFGTFIEKIHPAWINKLPTFPLPYQHGQSLVPFGQTGLQVRGAVPLGDGYKRFTYSAFVSNGFQQSTHGHGEEEGEEHEEEGEGEGEEHEEEEGLQSTGASWVEPVLGRSEEEGEEHDEDLEPIYLDGSSFNGNGQTAYGGRLSLLLAKGLEIGTSYLSGSYDDDGVLDATLFGFDFTYHHDLYDIRGEWLDSETELGLAEEGDPLGDQTVESWYIQPSLRLSVIPAYVFNRMELVARYARMDFTMIEQEQTSIGLNYYFNGSTILRVAWERLEETGRPAENSFHAMLAMGF